MKSILINVLLLVTSKMILRHDKIIVVAWYSGRPRYICMHYIVAHYIRIYTYIYGGSILVTIIIHVAHIY